MRALVLPILLSCLICAGRAAAWTEEQVTSGIMFLFERPEPEQAHPKTAVLAIPVLDEMVRSNTWPLTLNARYQTRFWGQGADDPRYGKGRVTMKIEVLRDDQVVWKRTIKDRVEAVFGDGWVFNGTDDLWACFDGDLQRDDVVLLRFTFKQLPTFNWRESAEIGVEITPWFECSESDHG